VEQLDEIAGVGGDLRQELIAEIGVDMTLSNRLLVLAVAAGRGRSRRMGLSS
jgi:hypothetical protein